MVPSIAAPDMSLLAMCLVIWVVAISVAFGFYIPVLRARAQAAVAGALADFPASPGEDLHRGLLATVTPVAVAMPQRESSPPAPAQIVMLEEVPAAAPVRTPPEPPPGFNVLIVDDNDTNRLVLEMILDSVGVAHASVENGLKAVEAMTVCPYQAVLMDIQMPVMDGLEATRRIRALETERGGAASSIIVVSANCQKEDIAAGRASGADEYLAKPISALALLGALESCASANRMAA